MPFKFKAIGTFNSDTKLSLSPLSLYKRLSIIMFCPLQVRGPIVPITALHKQANAHAVCQ